MWPTLARPNLGQALNLVDATFASQSGLHSSVLDHLEAVEPVLDVRPLRDDARGVPLADRLQVPCRRRIEAVGRGGAGQPRLVVGRFGIVEQLVLGAGGVDAVVVGLAREIGILDAAVENPAVAGATDAPLELELEVAELILGDQIAGVSVLGQRAVGDAASRPAPTGSCIRARRRATCRRTMCAIAATNTPRAVPRTQQLRRSRVPSECSCPEIMRLSGSVIYRQPRWSAQDYTIPDQRRPGWPRAAGRADAIGSEPGDRPRDDLTLRGSDPKV